MGIVASQFTLEVSGGWGEPSIVFVGSWLCKDGSEVENVEE